MWASLTRHNLRSLLQAGFPNQPQLEVTGAILSPQMQLRPQFDPEVDNPACLFIRLLFGFVSDLSCKQARKLQATLEGCNPKLSLTH